MENAAQRLTDAAPLATYGGGGATLFFWGLQVNEICAIVSTCIAAIGLGVQIYVAWKRSR